MESEDLEFWTGCAGGYAWYYQLLDAFELSQEELKNINHMAAGYWFDDKSILKVFGHTESGKRFRAKFYLSKNWVIPGESVYSLDELSIGIGEQWN